MSEENDQPLTLMKVRTCAGLTQREFADLLGVTISTVSNWERGVQVPRLTFLQTKLIMDASGFSIEELVEAFEGTQATRSRPNNEKRR
jgi:transcriptional regulator with XRE-family HTH domain